MGYIQILQYTAEKAPWFNQQDPHFIVLEYKETSRELKFMH